MIKLRSIKGPTHSDGCEQWEEERNPSDESVSVRGHFHYHHGTEKLGRVTDLRQGFEIESSLRKRTLDEHLLERMRGRRLVILLPSFLLQRESLITSTLSWLSISNARYLIVEAENGVRSAEKNEDGDEKKHLFIGGFKTNSEIYRPNIRNR